MTISFTNLDETDDAEWFRALGASEQAIREAWRKAEDLPMTERIATLEFIAKVQRDLLAGVERRIASAREAEAERG